MSVFVVFPRCIINFSFSLQFTLECRPMNEEHTAENISKVLSSQVNAIAGKVEGQRVTAVTDSAANMLRSVADTENIDSHARCVAHVINNAAEAGYKGSLAACIKRCKALAADSHKSSKVCTIIRRACQANDINYIKIIQPVKTRWHSMSMTMQSVFRLKKALLSIKARGDRDNKNVATLIKHIPSKIQFDAIEALIPHLKQIQAFSERLTSERRSTIHMVIPILVSFQNMRSNNPMASNFLTLFRDYLDSRIPNCGRDDETWAMGVFLNPYYKGSLLIYKLGGTVMNHIFEETKTRASDIVQQDKARADGSDEPPPEAEEGASTPSLVDTTGVLERALTDSQWASVEDYLASADLLTFGDPVPEASASNTIGAQLEVYQNSLQKMASPDGDVLDYWKSHQVTVPDLARFARSILCIPASSASSERMFSLAGRTITTQRTSISAARAEQLIYIHQNYNRAVAHITSWDLGAVEAVPEGKGKGKGKKSATAEEGSTPEPQDAAAIEAAAEALDSQDMEWNHSDVDPDTTDDEDLEEEVDATE